MTSGNKLPQGTEEIVSKAKSVKSGKVMCRTYFGIVCCDDISKISSWYAKIDRITHRDYITYNQVQVTGGVIHDLRKESAPIDGIGSAVKKDK